MTDIRTMRAVLKDIDTVLQELESYRPTTEELLGIKIPESEGPCEFILCLMRDFHRRAAMRAKE